MVFIPRKWRALAEVNMSPPVLFVAVQIDSEPGPTKVNLANIGAAVADDPVMQFNISGTIGA
jgi:hypothetical protein